MGAARVTRGRLTAAWLVLQSLDKLGGGAAVVHVLAYARRSSLRAGGLPIRDGARLAVSGGFIEAEGEVYSLTSLGRRALDLAQGDEPSPEVLKLLVTVLCLREPPSWVAWWQGSPGDLDSVIPPDTRTILHEAGLLPMPDSSDPAAWGWWQALARVPLPENTEVERKRIGDAGEALTVEFEQARLAEQGYPDLASQVLWVAQESDAYGFDVLSFAGHDHPPLEPERRIAIEVKSTALPGDSHFRCFFTAHEWQTAQALGERYVLHFWRAVDPGPPAASRWRHPTVLPAATLREHLPGISACNDSCGWQTARIELRLE